MSEWGGVGRGSAVSTDEANLVACPTVQTNPKISIKRSMLLSLTSEKDIHTDTISSKVRILSKHNYFQYKGGYDY